MIGVTIAPAPSSLRQRANIRHAAQRHRFIHAYREDASTGQTEKKLISRGSQEHLCSTATSNRGEGGPRKVEALPSSKKHLKVNKTRSQRCATKNCLQKRVIAYPESGQMSTKQNKDCRRRAEKADQKKRRLSVQPSTEREKDLCPQVCSLKYDSKISNLLKDEFDDQDDPHLTSLKYVDSPNFYGVELYRLYQHQNLLDDFSGVGSGKADCFLIQSENDIMCHTSNNSVLHVKTLGDLQGVLPVIPTLSQGPAYQISSMNTMSDFNRYLRLEKKNFDFRGSRRLFNIGSEKLSSEMNNDDDQQKFRRV